MLIKRITKIKDFGIFKKFDWDAGVPDFNVFNLAYGWNYSGKTTISRLFRCYELGQKHHDYPLANFEIETIDGTKYNASAFPPKLPIRVFNSDFIIENLRWNAGLSPIFLLGEENIQLQEDLKNEIEQLIVFNKKHADLKHEQSELGTNLSNSLTNKAKDIKLLLSIPVFDKRHLQQEIDNLPHDPTTIVLKDSDVSLLINKYKSVDKKNTLVEAVVHIPNLQDNCDSIKTLLDVTVKSKVIEN